jgi:hypothetical protein
MPKNIITPGDQFASKGTVPWADWQRSRMKHALKGTRFESRQISQVIRDMCEGEEPAWHLMTRGNGIGFRTFEEFVTDPEGLSYDLYPKFKALAVSDPGTMNEREYDLLTATPALKVESFAPRDPDATASSQRHQDSTNRTTRRLRAISRAPVLIRKLYIAGLIEQDLAAMMGPGKEQKDFVERKHKAERALRDIESISRNGDDAAYRRAVNDAVRRAFDQPVAKVPTALESAKAVCAKLTADEWEELIAWHQEQDAPAPKRAPRGKRKGQGGVT